MPVKFLKQRPNEDLNSAQKKTTIIISDSMLKHVAKWSKQRHFKKRMDRSKEFSWSYNELFKTSYSTLYAKKS